MNGNDRIKNDSIKNDNIEENNMEDRGKKDGMEKDVDTLIALLDGCVQAEESRIKVDVVEGEGKVVSRQYHHGRCDVGSPWACGTAFDVLE